MKQQNTMDDLSTKIATLSSSRRRLLALLLERRRVSETRHNAGESSGLVAFVVPKLKPAPETGELRTFLESKLPDYMVPSSFVMLESLPLTPNGKLDRRALPRSDSTGLAPRSGFVVPRDFVELKLVRLWEETLGARPIGVRDNFFELGGHSLLAIRLTFRIQQTFGVDLPLSILFQASTVEDLAVILRQQAEVPSWSPLVCVQADGSKPPFFCVHPGGGNVLCYVGLAQHLGSDQPFYAFQAKGLNGEQPFTSVEEMASQYVKAMIEMQPDGPYLLGGWSVGGLIAFEMARQIEASNQRLDLLALIDVIAPDRNNPDLYDYEDEVALMLTFAHNLGVPVERFTVSTELFQSLGSKDRWPYLLSHAREANVLPPGLTTTQIQRLFDVFTANVTAAKNYIPKISKCPITLFKASQRQPGFVDDGFLGWDGLSEAGTDVHEVPGSHFTMLREPEVRDLATRLKHCLDRVRG